MKMSRGCEKPITGWQRWSLRHTKVAMRDELKNPKNRHGDGIHFTIKMIKKDHSVMDEENTKCIKDRINVV